MKRIVSALAVIFTVVTVNNMQAWWERPCRALVTRTTAQPPIAQQVAPVCTPQPPICTPQPDRCVAQPPVMLPQPPKVETVPVDFKHGAVMPTCEMGLVAQYRSKNELVLQPGDQVQSIANR